MEPTTNGNIGRLAVAAAAIAAMVLTGCSSSGGSADDTTTTTAQAAVPLGNEIVDEGTPVKGGNLRIGLRAETNGWNPATSQWAQEGHMVGSSMFETLFVNNAAGEPVPWLAESITPNADYTVWSLTLRQGIKFHDGTEMNADAVVKSLTLMGSDGAFTSYAYGNLFETPVATGEYTLDIPLTQSWGVLPVALTSAYGYVMAPSMLDAPDKGTNDPVGTGAYEWKTGEAGRFVRVGAFKDYWGGPCTVENPTEQVVALCAEMGAPLGQPNGPFLDSIEFQPIVDSLQRAQSLESGDIDMMMTTTPADTARLRADYQVVTDYNTEQGIVMLKTTKAPFDNIHARKALAYATDRNAIKDLFGAGEDIGMDTSPFEEGSRWGGLAPDETGYPLYDPAKAQQEVDAYKADMAAAGTPVNTLEFELLGIATPEDTLMEQVLAEQWAKVGIKASTKVIAQEAMAGELIGTNWTGLLFRSYAFPDPDAQYVYWSEENAQGAIKINFTEFWNATTQDALVRGRTSADVEVRRKAYSDLVAERNANVPDLWLYNTPWAIVANPNVRGLNAFRTLGMATYNVKPYVSGLWIDPNA